MNAVSLPVACGSKQSLAIARSLGLAAMPKRVRDAGDDTTGHSKAPLSDAEVPQHNWLDGLSLTQEGFASQHYLGRLIATGGYGRVHLLRSRHDSRVSVCKVMPKQRTDRLSASAQRAYKEQVIMVRWSALLRRPSSLRHDWLTAAAGGADAGSPWQKPKPAELYSSF